MKTEGMGYLTETRVTAIKTTHRITNREGCTALHLKTLLDRVPDRAILDCYAENKDNVGYYFYLLFVEEEGE